MTGMALRHTLTIAGFFYLPVPVFCFALPRFWQWSLLEMNGRC